MERQWDGNRKGNREDGNGEGGKGREIGGVERE